MFTPAHGQAYHVINIPHIEDDTDRRYVDRRIESLMKTGNYIISVTYNDQNIWCVADWASCDIADMLIRSDVPFSHSMVEWQD